MIALVVLFTAFGCKSKKKAMEAQAAEKARMEQEAALKRQQEEEARRKAEEEEKARRETASKTSAKYTILGQYFQAISTASDVTSANNSINEALTMFASPDTPVLIVISESNGQKDYDRPTTIREYLNYIKDQKKDINKIENLTFDDAGKITEVELRKNQ